MSLLKSKKFIIAIVALSLMAALGAIGYLAYTSYSQTMKVDKPRLFTIEKGSSLNKVCQQLIAEEVISDCLGHKLYSKIDSNIAHFKAGTYKLKNKAILAEFFQQVVLGKEQQFPFTILAGDNIYQVLAKVKKAPSLDDDVNGQSMSDIAKLLDLPVSHPEGYLFPETYFYAAETKASDLLSRAVAKQNRVLNVQWVSRDKSIPIASKYQALILASIVEKESSLDSERETIASVFYNRLNKRMRLQTDPTVIYGVWNQYQGDITRKHLQQKTPYNTYRINGLPPTPIANPSERSIAAVTQPATTDYLYFVASGEGGHVFNKTLSAHNKSVQDYLKKTKNKK